MKNSLSWHIFSIGVVLLLRRSTDAAIAIFDCDSFYRLLQWPATANLMPIFTHDIEYGKSRRGRNILYRRTLQP